MSRIRGFTTCIVSHPSRAASLERVKTQLAELDLGPAHVELHPDGLAPSDRAQFTLARQAIYKAPRCPLTAQSVLFLEDDIELDAALPYRVADALALNEAVTFYLPGDEQYQPDDLHAIRDGWVRDTPIDPHVAPVLSLSRWWGSQALLLPHDVAFGASKTEPGCHGFDMALKLWLIRNRRPLYACVPNPVQHLGLPSVAPRRVEERHRSCSYGLPSLETAYAV